MPDRSHIVPGHVLLSCSVMRREVEAVAVSQGQGCAVEAFDSQLHMEPSALQADVAPRVRHHLSCGRRVVLVCGDCCPGMHSLTAQPGVQRVAGHNCVEIMLGRSSYRQLQQEGGFALFPEWTERWRELLPGLLGLPDAEVREVFQESHSHLVYLDTGLLPVPEPSIRACSEWCGLPCSVRRVTLDVLASSIEDCLQRFAHD